MCFNHRYYATRHMLPRCLHSHLNDCAHQEALRVASGEPAVDGTLVHRELSYLDSIDPTTPLLRLDMHRNMVHLSKT